MELKELTEALAQPAGANAALLEPLLDTFFHGKLPREVAAGPRTYKLGAPEDADKLLRHVAGGSWASALVKLKLPAMAHDRLLALGFKDAPLADVEAFLALNSIPIARILEAREDAAEALVELAKKHAGSKRIRNAALAAAIARSSPVPPELERDFDLAEAGWAPLLRAALKALGPERATPVALRTMKRFDASPELRWQALVDVLECFGPFFTPDGEHRIAERVEELSTAPGASHEWWEEVGQRLAASGEWDAAIAFVRSRLPVNAHWRRTMRALLDERVHTGWALDPAFDEFIDPAHAATLSYDVRQCALRLLESLPAERAEKLLSHAAWVQPADVLRFLRGGMSDAWLDRVAETLVSLRDDHEHKNTLVATNLRPLGTRFGKALERALAEVKPRPGFLAALERNLDAPVFAGLSTWLAVRPEPKRTKKSVVAGSDEETVKMPAPGRKKRG